MTGELFTEEEAPIVPDVANQQRALDAVRRYADHTGLSNWNAYQVLTNGGQVDALRAAQERSPE